MDTESQGKSQESQVKNEPSVSKPIEPSTPPKTYNQGEVDKLVAGVQSGLDKKVEALTRTVGLNKTSDTNLKAQLKAEKEVSAGLRKTSEEAEFAAIPRDNADALSMWTAKQAHKEEVRAHEANVAKFLEMKAELETDIADVKEFKKFKGAVEIVSRDEFKGVKADDLVNLTDGSPDKMEALAKVLVLTVNPNPAPPIPPETPPDPGSNIGGTGQLSNEEMETMSMEQYASHPSNKGRFQSTYETAKT